MAVSAQRRPGARTLLGPAHGSFRGADMRRTLDFVARGGGASFRAFSPLKTKGGILVHPHQALARSSRSAPLGQWRLARLLAVRLAGDHREAVGGAFPARDLLLDPDFMAMIIGV